MSLEKKIINFLKGPRKGETFELKSGLVSQYKFERKDAIQRVIQAMTIGKDVSSLFPDVLKNIATHDLEQKKLVYLYLMNYAKLHPELCILAVNTFVQDTEDPNPLVRALAIRTMGCIRVDKMVDYMEIPLRRTLQDDNPYVRKTAAVCVAKLFDLSPQMCMEYGFLEALQKLMTDPNPMVVANALNALLEIRDMNRDLSLSILVVDAATVKILLACLNECTEWGRITILTCLAEYRASEEEALHILERCVPQLQHANPLVVLLAIKVVVHHMESLNQAAQASFLKKLAAPLVSLVSLDTPEAQYVGLRNIRVVLEKHPQVLARELRVFFIKYLDPLYVKLEKLEIVVRLAAEANATLLLGELKEYAMEVEPVLVSRAIGAIGAVAIKLKACVVHAVSLLVALIDERGGQVVVDSCVDVLAQILRRYPRQNDLVTLVVPVVATQIGNLSDLAATAAYVFLLGEYPKYFTGVRDKVQVLVDGFLDLEPAVQLHVLTAVVKIALAVPSSGCLPLLQTVLDKATQECDDADVRDKAYIYWRLMSSEKAEAVILAPLPPIETVIASFSPAVLDTLVNELSTLSSVYHKPASTFIDADAYTRVESQPPTANDIGALTKLAKQEIINNSRNENLLNLDDDEPVEESKGGSILDELNDLFSVPAPQGQTPQGQTGATAQSSTNDILGLFEPTAGVANLNLGQKPQEPTKLSDDLLDLL